MHLFVFAVVVFPAFSMAAVGPEGSRFVPCTNDADAKGNVENPCGFPQLLTLINNIVKFILKDLAIPITAIMFVYAGIVMVTSGGSPEARSKAKGIFTNAALGLIIAAAAWLIVHTLLNILGYTGEGFGLE